VRYIANIFSMLMLFLQDKQILKNLLYNAAFMAYLLVGLLVVG